MSTVAKILIVVNVILAGAFLAAASTFLSQQETWKTKHADQETYYTKEMAKLNATIEARDGRIDTLNGQVSSAQAQAQAAQAESAQMRAQNDMLKEAHTQTSSQLTTATEALARAQDTIRENRSLIQQLQDERATLAEAKRVAVEAKDAAVRNLNEKEIQMENLLAQNQQQASRISDLEDQVRSAELALQSVQARMPGLEVAVEQPAHQGRVIAADADANIAIISLGAEDGVKPGFRYTVSRGSDYITTIEITDVQAKQSAGRSLRDLEKSPVRQGDRVMSR